MTDKSKPKTVVISEKLHTEIKERASQQGRLMNRYTEMLLIDGLNKDRARETTTAPCGQ